MVDWTPAEPGDLVMASPVGIGKIEYAYGCVVEVKAGAVVAVQQQSPCKTGSTGRFGSKPGYLIGGVIVAAVVAGAIALSGGGADDDDDNNRTGDKPASP